MTHIINSTPAQEYLTDLANRAAKKTTAEATYILRDFNEYIAGRPIDAMLLSDWRNHLATLKIADGTRNLFIRHVKMMLNWQADTGRGAAINLRCLKAFKEDKKQPVVLSREEIQRLIKACNEASEEDQRVAKTILVMLYTGCRRHEAIELTRHNVKVNGLLIWSDKTRSERMFPLALLGSAVTLLDGRKGEWNRYAWAKIRKAAQLKKLTPKGLRSTAATYLISAPVTSHQYNPHTCAALMGHSLQTAEKFYWGAPVFGITGTSMPEFYALQSADDRAAPTPSPESAQARERADCGGVAGAAEPAAHPAG